MSSPKELLITIDKCETTQNNSKNNEDQKAEVNILCLDLKPLSPLAQFLSCCALVFLCYLLYGYLLELIFSPEEVKPISFYITLVQFVMTTALSYAESLVREPVPRKVPLRTYALLAALTLGTMALSNLALSYLNYPTQLIFKTCKLIPVMVGSILILGKSYSALDYAAAALMCLGLCMFTLADSETSPKFDAVGVGVISLALLCDAVIGNVQERAMRQHGASNNEVVLYSYALGSAMLLALTAASGVLRDGFAYCAQAPAMYALVAALSISGFAGLQAVLTLVRLCGATVAVTVTTMRKALSIVISFLLFSKPFVFQYVWSGALVVLAVYLHQHSRRHGGRAPLPLRACWTGCARASAACWACCVSAAAAEHRYLRARTKMAADVV